MPRPWLDISVPIRERMPVWPGDPPVRFRPVTALRKHDASNVTAASLCLHTGTHIDAPRHYFQGGAGVEAIPADVLIGPARVVHIKRGGAIHADLLRPLRIRSGDRILFRTGNSTLWNSATFHSSYVHLTPDAAEFLAGCGIRLVGIDYLSIGAPDESGDEVHRILLSRGICILEGLNLFRIRAGRHDLVCLPLRIPDADGAPARALLRPR